MAKSKLHARKSAGGKAQNPKPSTGAGPSSAPDAASLIDKAHTLLAQSNFELAIKFLARAIQLEPANLEARELLGVAELEGGDPDVGRERRVLTGLITPQHLLHLFPPHTAEPPSSPSPYLYLAQSASDPQEALGYYSTGASIIERKLGVDQGKGKGRVPEPGLAETETEDVEAEERAMAVRCLVAMIEIWMSDLCMEDAAEANCEALVTRALGVAPEDVEVRLALASIRMSQSRADEARDVVLGLFNEMEGKEPFDPTLPSLPARLNLARQLLEHSLHLEALDTITTAREEDELNVEAAYLEGWAWFLRAEAVLENPSFQVAVPPKTESRPARGEVEMEGDENQAEEDEDSGPENMSPDECFAESMRALVETAKLYSEQEYPDEGIGAHTAELLEGLEKRGVKPAILDEAEGETEGEDGGWEDVEDVEMA
ncbi:hypothetical protein EHS25_000077 [Saitozyma podzolica]|uniref:Uncharacterized protein n=1 Tax=Saitozyma podzolica TaxID=1890683 RepID=A0A427YV82_9TREE|nr:hypothetical protein EHS25_000077 [Saitozyma podzolica]